MDRGNQREQEIAYLGTTAVYANANYGLPGSLTAYNTSAEGGIPCFEDPHQISEELASRSYIIQLTRERRERMGI